MEEVTMDNECPKCGADLVIEGRPNGWLAPLSAKIPALDADYEVCTECDYEKEIE